MLKFKEFINEELQFEINITKPLYLEFGEDKVLLTKDGPQSHIRDNFQRTIDKITIFDNGHKVVNKDGVVNKVPINKDQVLDDVLFSTPKIIDFIFRGRAELIRGWGRLVTPDICLKIDPTYKPNERAILLHIKNIRTGLNTILKFRYHRSSNDSDAIVLMGVTTIWKPDFKNYCLREDYTIEIDNDNISKFYTQYPLK